MVQIITIVAGRDWDLDHLDPVIANLAEAGLIFPFADGEIARPVVEMQPGVEVQCDPANYAQACNVIEGAGFQVVGRGDS